MKRVTEFVKYCHPESSIMCPEPYLDIMYAAWMCSSIQISKLVALFGI